jgi:hypothetical protein
VTEWLSDWVTEWLSDWVTEWLSDWVMSDEWWVMSDEWWVMSDEWLSDWVTEWLSDWVTEWLSDWDHTVYMNVHVCMYASNVFCRDRASAEDGQVGQERDGGAAKTQRMVYTY